MLNITDAASVTAFKLTMRREGVPVGIGSGFLFFHNGSTFLVTARHNLTRMNAITGAPLVGLSEEHSPVAYPNELELRLPNEIRHEDGKSKFDAQPCLIKIWYDQNPVWRVHDPEDLSWDVGVIDLAFCCAKKTINCPNDDDQATFRNQTELLVRSTDFVQVNNGQKIRLASITNYLTEGFPYGLVPMHSSSDFHRA